MEPSNNHQFIMQTLSIILFAGVVTAYVHHNNVTKLIQESKRRLFQFKNPFQRPNNKSDDYLLKQNPRLKREEVLDSFGQKAVVYSERTCSTDTNEVSTEIISKNYPREASSLHINPQQNSILIRLQGEVDHTLQKLLQTTDPQKSIRNQIKITKERQCYESGRCDIMTGELSLRSWIPRSSTSGGASSSEERNELSVVQFNCLAEGLSAGPNTSTPFEEKAYNSNDKKKSSTFGGFTAVVQPEVCLNFDYRKWRLLEVLVGDNDSSQQQHNSLLPDIIAIEEMDRFHGFFEPALKAFGYSGLFVPKPNAPGICFGFYSDGCSLFWKTDKFDLLEEKRIPYGLHEKNDKFMNQVMIIAKFRHRFTGQSILVAVTHLKAKNTRENEIVRTQQVTELLSVIDKNRCNGTTPCIILGDFNANPDGICISSIINKVSYNRNDDTDFNGGQASTSSFVSTYKLNSNNDNDKIFTTWKTRKDGNVKRIIDYILYSKGSNSKNGRKHMMECTHILSIPSAEDIGDPHGLPGLCYPSDHISIGARFQLSVDEE